MSDKARADTEGDPPSDDAEDHESWLREAVHAPLALRMPRAGDVLGGRYRVEDILGRGGMGVVFRARHMVSEKTVALKWMLRPTSGDQARKRFEREARAAGRIDHPNVVDLYDVGEDGDSSYLVMELLRGQSLRKRLAHGPIEPREALDLLVPAMRGVAAAHRAGVIHRDLKPDNIFLCHERESGQREVKVLDFGVSSITSLEAVDSTLTQEGTLLGSLAYMSPEQLRNPHEVDARTDVYAFGVILFEVLSGQLPFQGLNQSGLIIAITTGEPKRLSDLRPTPFVLEEVVARAMAREREDRYPDIAALIDALLPYATPSLELRASMAVAARLSAPQPSNPQHDVRSSPGSSAVPLVLAGGEGAAGARLQRGARLRLVWIGAVLLMLLALWSLTSSMRSESAAPLAQPAPSTPTIAPVHAEAPAISLPAAEPAARPAPVAVEPEATSPSATEQAKRKPRAQRSKPPAEQARSPVNDIEAKEKALFSGRK